MAICKAKGSHIHVLHFLKQSYPEAHYHLTQLECFFDLLIGLILQGLAFLHLLSVYNGILL